MDRFFVNVRTALGVLLILAIVYYVAGTAVLLIAAFALIQWPLYMLVRRKLRGVDRDAFNTAESTRQFKARPLIQKRLDEVLEMYAMTLAEDERTIAHIAPGFQRLVDRSLRSWQ